MPRRTTGPVRALGASVLVVAAALLTMGPGGHAGAAAEAGPRAGVGRSLTLQTEPTEAGASQAAPLLESDRASHDFGVIADDSPVKTEFTLHNAGAEAVTIARVSTTCGCTTGEVSKSAVPAGGSAVLRVAYDPAWRDGRDRRSVVVEDADGRALATVAVIAQVDPLVRVSPKLLYIGEVARLDGRVSHGGVLLTVEGQGADFRVHRVAAGDAPVSAELVSRTPFVAEGPHAGEARRVRYVYEVRVRDDAELGRINGSLSVHTSSETRLEVPVGLYAEVVGDARAAPGLVNLRQIVRGEAFAAEVTLDTRSGQPLKVVSVGASSRLRLRWTTERRGTKTVLRLEGVADPGEGEDRLNEQVQIITSADGGHPLRVTLIGSVAEPRQR